MKSVQQLKTTTDEDKKEVASLITLTANGTLVTTAGRSYIQLTSDNANGANRVFCLDAGTTGQELILEWTSSTNKGGLQDAAASCTGSVTTNLNGNWISLSADSTLHLIYSGAKWIELSRLAN